MQWWIGIKYYLHRYQQSIHTCDVILLGYIIKHMISNVDYCVCVCVCVCVFVCVCRCVYVCVCLASIYVVLYQIMSHVSKRKLLLCLIQRIPRTAIYIMDFKIGIHSQMSLTLKHMIEITIDFYSLFLFNYFINPNAINSTCDIL